MFQLTFLNCPQQILAILLAQLTSAQVSPRANLPYGPLPSIIEASGGTMCIPAVSN